MEAQNSEINKINTELVNHKLELKHYLKTQEQAFKIQEK